MAEQKLNIDVPEDCLKLLKACLEKANKNGAFTLEESFYIHLAAKSLNTFIFQNKSLGCGEIGCDKPCELSNFCEKHEKSNFEI